MSSARAGTASEPSSFMYAVVYRRRSRVCVFVCVGIKLYPQTLSPIFTLPLHLPHSLSYYTHTISQKGGIASAH